MRDAILERGLERANGVGRPAALPVDERQVAIGVGRVGPPRDHLLERLRGILELSSLIEVAGAVQHRVDLDQALGIVGFAVAVAWRGRAAADVAERAQPVADGRRFFARQGRRRHVEPAQRVEQDLGPCAVAAGQVALFARIGVERVELLRRQVDVLVPADDDPAKRRPAARQVRRHRLEVGRPILAAAAADQISTSDAPGSAATAGAPTASRMVGTTSTWRTAASMVTPVAASQPTSELRNDQRHSQRRLVGEDAVRQLAVVAEALAVIRGDDDERLARQAARRSKSGAEREVGPGDFAGVRDPSA